MGFDLHTSAIVEFCQPICIEAVSMKKLLIFLLKYKAGDLPVDPEALKHVYDDDDEYDDWYEEYLDLDVTEFTGEHRALVEKLNKEVGGYYNNCFECLDAAFKLFLKRLDEEVTQEFDNQVHQLPQDVVSVVNSYHQHEMMNFELKAEGSFGCYNETDDDAERESLRLVYKTYFPQGSGIDYGRFYSNIPFGISLTKIDTMDTKKKEIIGNLMQFILQKTGLKATSKPGWFLCTEGSGG